MVNAFYYSNTAVQTKLSGSISAGALAITVNSVTGFPTQYPYVLALDFGAAAEELVTITGAALTVLTVGTRGFGGTSAQSHSAGADVAHVYNAVDATDFRSHEQANTGVHGVSGAVVGTDSVQTLTNKTLTAPTINAPFTADEMHVNSGTTLTPLAADAIAGTTADLEVIQLNGSTRRRLSAAGQLTIAPQAGASNGYFMNSSAAFAGKLMDLQVNSVSKFNIANSGQPQMPAGWLAGAGDVTSVDASGNLTVNGPSILGTASLAAYGGIGGFRAAYKPSATTRTTTTRSADPDLLLSLTLNQRYILDGFLIYDAPTAEDISFEWTFPTGTTMQWGLMAQGTGASGPDGQVYTGSFTQATMPAYGTIGAGAASSVTAILNGLVFTGGTSGNLTLTWAQFGAGATGTTLREGSWIRINRVA